MTPTEDDINRESRPRAKKETVASPAQERETPPAPALPPEILADALQDRITPSSGKLITARPVTPAQEREP